jgi:hypothetical protein
MAGGGGAATSSAPTGPPTRISSSVLGFNWCMKKPVALGSSTPPGARRAKGAGGMMQSYDNDTAVDAGDGGVTGANVHHTLAAKGASPNPARDLAESLSAFGDVPFSPRKDCENTGECGVDFMATTPNNKRDAELFFLFFSLPPPSVATR